MIKIALASQNPVKYHAVLNGFERMFLQDQLKLKTFPVESGVADQPLSDQETYQGAFQRAGSVK